MTSIHRPHYRWQFPILFKLRRIGDEWYAIALIRPLRIKIVPEERFSYSAFLMEIDDE